MIWPYLQKKKIKYLKYYINVQKILRLGWQPLDSYVVRWCLKLLITSNTMKSSWNNTYDKTIYLLLLFYVCLAFWRIENLLYLILISIIGTTKNLYYAFLLNQFGIQITKINSNTNDVLKNRKTINNFSNVSF